jgi:hypothetical protein
MKAELLYETFRRAELRHGVHHPLWAVLADSLRESWEAVAECLV